MQERDKNSRPDDRDSWRNPGTQARGAAQTPASLAAPGGSGERGKGNTQPQEAGESDENRDHSLNPPGAVLHGFQFCLTELQLFSVEYNS